MNRNPTRGSSRKKKKMMMNVITKTVSSAVLVALGLTLTTWAAEPAATPNAQIRGSKPDWAKFDWAKLGAGAVAEYAKPLPPGIHGKSQFCAPRFAFQVVEGAKQYRFTVTHWDKDRKDLADGKYWVFDAAEPSASLLPVWNDLPICTNSTWLRVTVEGLDARGGKPVPGASQVSFFRKGQPWTDPFAKTKLSRRENAMEAIRRSMADGMKLQYTFYKDHRLPIDGKRDPDLAKRFAGIEPTFVAAGVWLASSSSLLAGETQDPQEKALALRIARNAMDTVIACANPADWKYGFYANMVRGLGPNWTGYLSGEKTFEEWLADMHAASAARYEMMQDCMVCEPGFAFLNVYDVTQDQKYLDAAKRLAKAYADTQLPSGGWPYYVNAKTGDFSSKGLGGEYPPALTVLFFDRLATQYWIRDFVPAADRAFQWIMENQVKIFDHRSHFWDIGPQRPGGSQGSLAGAEIAMCLFNRAEKDPKYMALGEEYLRRVENSFIWWEEGGGGRVSEQTGYMNRIGFSGGGVAQAFARAFEATGNPLYLAKAMSLARALDVAHAGNYVWGDYSAPRWAINLLEMHQFLKKHNLQDWPGLSAQPETLSFALANPSDGSIPQQVAIIYRGPGADKPFITSAADPWVKITAGAGAGNGQTFAVSLEPKGLPPGIHASKTIVCRPDIREALVLPVRLRLGTLVPKVISIIHPTAGHCRSKGTLRCVAGVRDQFGEPLDTELRWSVSGGGTITPQGIFTNDGTAGEFTVTVATAGDPSVSAATVLRVPPGDCFARWTLDDTGVADVWGNISANIVGGAPRVPGKVGGALRFDGKGQYVQTDTILDDLKLPCTFAFWVNPDATQGDLANIFGNHEGSTHGLVMQQEGATANKFHFAYGSKPVGGGAGPVQLTANTWQHVAIVCDGREVVIYLDGKEAARGEGKNPLTPNPRLGFRLGSGFSGGRFFAGALDDFRIYSRVLTVAEVETLARETDKGEGH